MPDARAELRERLIDQLRGFTCPHDEIVGCPPCQADRVLDLFPGDVTERWTVHGSSPGWGEGEWVIATAGRSEAVAYAAEANARQGSARACRVLILTTAPQPIRETEDA